MTKTIEELYAMQEALDARIILGKGLMDVDLLPNTVLALQVEIGELANEWRGFKHWSKDQAPRYERRSVAFADKEDGSGEAFEHVSYPLLEEYVDCLHFFLSIARQLNVPAALLNVQSLENTGNQTPESTVAIFTSLMYEVAFLSAETFMTHPPFVSKHKRLSFVFHDFLDLGGRFGFTWEQIAAAYVAKNEVNHARQQNGY